MPLRFLLSLLVLATTMVEQSGCATSGPASVRPLSVAIAITPVGVPRVSAAQLAEIHRVLEPDIRQAGYAVAASSASADLVLTVAFAPNPGGAGGRIKLTSLEPTDEFRSAMDGGDSPEAKELRRRAREAQAWVEGAGIHSY